MIFNTKVDQVYPRLFWSTKIPFLPAEDEKAMQFLVFIAALLFSAIFTRLVRDFANRHGWATPPASDRHIHTLPTPRLGGVAIFLTLRSNSLLARSLSVHFGLSE